MSREDDNAGFGGPEASVRGRLRIAFWITLMLAPLLLAFADRASRGPTTPKAGIRVVTVNVDTRPREVADALRALDPDLVFMQEVAVSCRAAAQVLGLHYQDGSDQCLLSRWPLLPLQVTWPGPWQPPQLAATTYPAGGTLALINLRFAIPEVVAAVATMGGQWYTEQQRRNQYPALRAILGDRSPALACGDFNALPFEVALSPRLRDAWTGVRFGGTFPARLPAARIDQCWLTRDLTVRGTWTHVVPSDHRALVVDIVPTPGLAGAHTEGVS